MSLGSVARTILGDRYFPIVGRWYRGLFVDLTKVAASFPPVPPGATILDIGGGDGELINELLDLYPDSTVTMVDPSPRLGSALRQDLREMVVLKPSTTVHEYATTGKAPDFILVSDVLHHVPVEARAGFFADIRGLLGGKHATLIIKDLEPGYMRTHLGFLSDRIVSGDRNVNMISQRAATMLVTESFPGATVESTNLFSVDAPNYALVFHL